MPTKVVHCKKAKYDVYIGRPSEWANPFSDKPSAYPVIKVKDRMEAIAKYREWILTRPDLLSRLNELKGKTLGCWCRPLACHGDVLVQLIKERLGDERGNVLR